jgi:hypothetical protein
VLADPEKVVVTLTSDGGEFVTAFLVGDHIRLTGMTTFVPADKTCASACAFVWLAGRPRTFGRGARIGFHGVYQARTGQQPSVPNALLGTYLGYLGFGYDAVVWMVSAQPGAMHWLTAESAKKYGIDYQPLSPPHENAPRPEQLPPPSPQKPLQVRVVQDLHLRTQPDPHAPDALSPPNDVMPQGSQVAIAGKCRPWMGSGRGAEDADNIWCEVSYGEHRGWVNAYYLAAPRRSPPGLGDVSYRARLLIEFFNGSDERPRRVVPVAALNQGAGPPYRDRHPRARPGAVRLRRSHNQ